MKTTKEPDRFYNPPKCKKKAIKCIKAMWPVTTARLESGFTNDQLKEMADKEGYIIRQVEGVTRFVEKGWD